MPTWLHSRAEATGPLRFDRFMELALYDPAHGYYTTRISGVGRSADFSTSPTLSPTLGRAVAAWIREQPLRQVIEVGAGTGALAEAILRALPLTTRLRLRYHIVDRSPILRALQQKRLGKRARWHDGMESALRATRGEALIFSNELADAFPARIFRATATAGRFEELHLETNGDQWTERWVPPDTLPDSSVFGRSWPEGQRLEVLESYHHWLAAWTPHWKRGALLTIDYGDTPKEIYHRRPGGSLRGYLHHELVTGPALYLHPGRQDLTTDVNFEDLQDWGAALGLRNVSYQTQAYFLRPQVRPTDADSFLTDPHGVGGAFKALLQARPPGAPPGAPVFRPAPAHEQAPAPETSSGPEKKLSSPNPQSHQSRLTSQHRCRSEDRRSRLRRSRHIIIGQVLLNIGYCRASSASGP